MFSFPEIQAGTELILKLRLSQDLEGTIELANRKVHSLKAHIGNPLKAPELGTFQLKLGTAAESPGVNVTEKLAFDISDDDFSAAINALTDPALASLLPCTVLNQDGARRIRFADHTVEVEITCVDNELWPPSFVNADANSFDEGYIHIVELLQTPVAATSTYSTIVPESPSVIQMQAGTENEAFKINEIQKLHIPPEFAAGAIQLKRGFALTGIIGFPTSADEIAEKLEPLADDGGAFVVTGTQNGVYIEFTGEMGAQGQDLLEVEVFDSPLADIIFTLDTNTAGMRALMRRPDTEGKIEVPLEIELELEDEQIEYLYHPIKWKADLVFSGSVLDDDRNVSADLKWNQPRARKDAKAHSPNSVMVGHRSHRELLGDGVATSFAINHNLGTNAVEFTVDDNSDVVTSVNHRMSNGDTARVSTSGTLPAGLSAGTDYYVISRTPDTFKLSQEKDGASIDITDTGTGPHTVTRNETTDAGVHVTVYDLTNNNRRVPDNEYELSADTENALTVSGFATTPTSDQYVAYVTLISQPATYQAHTHTQDEIEGFLEWKAAIEAAIAALQLLSPSAALFSAKSSNEKVSVWDLPDIFEVFPTRSTFERPSVEEGLKGLVYPPRWRAGGLLPAVHDVTVDNISTILVNGRLPAASSYSGKVFVNDGGTDVLLLASMGRRSVYLKPSEWVASDGARWFRVTPYNRQGSTTFTVDTTDDILMSTAHNLANGNVVQLTTSGALPAPLVLATDYYVVSRTDTTLQLSLTEFGTPIDLASVGTGIHSVALQDEVSYYPTDFERELFRFDVTDTQLVLKSKLEMLLGISMGLLPPKRGRRERESSAQWTFVIEIGSYPEATDPSGIGMNLGDPVWNANPVLEQRIILGPVSHTHLFGIEVLHQLVGNDPTITLNKLVYGQASASVPPASTNFAVRGRLIRFDTEDSVSDPRGAVIIAGLASEPRQKISNFPDDIGFARIV